MLQHVENILECSSLASLAGLANEHDSEVGVVSYGVGHHVRATTNNVPESNEELN